MKLETISSPYHLGGMIENGGDMSDSERPVVPSTFDAAVGCLKNDGGYDLTVAALLFANGLPVPPSIIKRVRIGVGRLIDGSFDFLAGTLERKKARLDFNAKVQEEVVKDIAKSGTKALAEHSGNIATSVALSMLNDYGLKFDNKAAVAQQAIAELAKEPLSEDEMPDAELSVDWLNYFADIAAQKSDPEMQLLMGKILAGEIRKPGSFSPMTINALSTLTTSIAQKFEQLCSVSVDMDGMSLVLTNVFPEFLSKGIPEIGFTYVDLLNLRSHQLLANESGSTWTLTPGSENLISTCGKKFLIRATGSGGEQAIPSALFSQVGTEMRRLVSPTCHAWFDAKISTFFAEPNWQLTPIDDITASINSGI